MTNQSTDLATVPSLTVGILTANRDNLLGPLLEELVRQLEPADKVLVLDTTGSNLTKELIETVGCTQVAYVSYRMRHFDFASARNEIIARTNTEALAFIDDDAFPFPDWMKRIKSNLTSCKISGGPTVAASPLPDWWHSDINWCIGLSTPGVVHGLPGHYPDTCNIAARTEVWLKHPFNVIPRQEGNLYRTGREDAEWWMNRRLEGDKTNIDYRQAVQHTVHPDRTSWNYIKERAKTDGEASWVRRPVVGRVEPALMDIQSTARSYLDQILLKSSNKRQQLSQYIWGYRQWGVLSAIWSSKSEERPARNRLAYQVMQSAGILVKREIGRETIRALNFIRHRGEFPPTVPHRLFVSADCHLGDTILLRRHINQLAQTFPSSEVLVSSKFPELLTGLSKNIKVVSGLDSRDEIVRNIKSISAAFVPYFPFGDTTLWRQHLAQVGTTFNSDVGFKRGRDILYARRIIEKNMDVHEHENLSRLFSLLPLKRCDLPKPVTVPDKDFVWANQTLADAGVSHNYVTVQLGGGYAAKEWPLEYWIPFLRNFLQATRVDVVLIGAANWKASAETACTSLAQYGTVVNLVGGTEVGQLAALVKNSRYFIGGCSGPKHIAVMYDIPTFTLYIATEPVRWGATENHHLHGYIEALPQKLAQVELEGLSDDHRPRLLNPEVAARAALHHYASVMRREK